MRRATRNPGAAILLILWGLSVSELALPTAQAIPRPPLPKEKHEKKKPPRGSKNGRKSEKPVKRGFYRGATAALKAVLDSEKFDAARIQWALRNGADPNIKDLNGFTPLMWAAQEGHTDVVRLLLVKGAKIETKDTSGGWTALMQAAANGGNAETVRLLLQKGANLHVRNSSGETPLIVAASSGDVGVARLLLDKGARINDKDHEGETALIKAAWFGHTNVVRLLLEKGAQVNVKDSTALYNAAYMGNATIVRLLLDKNADPNPALSAAKTEEIKKMLRDAGAK